MTKAYLVVRVCRAPAPARDRAAMAHPNMAQR